MPSVYMSIVTFNQIPYKLVCRLCHFSGHPYSLYETDTTRFWVHYGLVILGAVLALVTAVAQWRDPAPYGKHERKV